MVVQKSVGKFSTYLAMGSFGIGTLFLLLHLLFPKEADILIWGFLYVLLAIVLNCFSLLILLILYIGNRLERETIAIRIMIVLANIPIAILYTTIVIQYSRF